MTLTIREVPFSHTDGFPTYEGLGTGPECGRASEGTAHVHSVRTSVQEPAAPRRSEVTRRTGKNPQSSLPFSLPPLSLSFSPFLSPPPTLSLFLSLSLSPPPPSLCFFFTELIDRSIAFLPELSCEPNELRDKHPAWQVYRRRRM